MFALLGTTRARAKEEVAGERRKQIETKEKRWEKLTLELEESA